MATYAHLANVIVVWCPCVDYPSMQMASPQAAPEKQLFDATSP